MKYLLFGGDKHYSEGGIKDLLSVANEKQDLIDYIKNDFKHDYWQIVSLQDLEDLLPYYDTIYFEIYQKRDGELKFSQGDKKI